MAIRRIIRMGHPLLRAVARPLEPQEIDSPQTARLIEDMIDTLGDYGGIGLAAPQIGESVRLAIVDIPGGATRYGDLEPVSRTVFVNPTIEIVDPTTAGYWEGCLSVPGLRGYVERPQHLIVRYTTLENESQVTEFKGFPATLMQHEFDHLDGKLYIDSISDTGLLAFEEEYERYLSPRRGD